MENGGRSYRNARPWVGMLLAVLLLLGGRFLRERLILDDQGLLRDPSWLQHLLLAEAAQAAEARETADPERLTTPLPINTCSRDSLTLLPGVGPVTAERIAAGRAAGLVFRHRRDLEKIKGIGPRLSARLDTLVVYAAARDDSLSAQPAASPPGSEMNPNSR